MIENNKLYLIIVNSKIRIKENLRSKLFVTRLEDNFDKSKIKIFSLFNLYVPYEVNKEDIINTTSITEDQIHDLVSSLKQKNEIEKLNSWMGLGLKIKLFDYEIAYTYKMDKILIMKDNICFKIIDNNAKQLDKEILFILEENK